MGEFAQDNTDVAPITQENIDAGFAVCQNDSTSNSMPFTTSYVNATFRWLCSKIDFVGDQIASVIARLDALNIINIGGGARVYKQRVGDNFQVRSIRANKGIVVSETSNEIRIGQTLICCYSDLGFSAGVPSNTFVANILVDDVTDPSAPVTYVWSCAGSTYVPLSNSTPTPVTTPSGNGFNGITSNDCDGISTGTISNTDNTYTYTVTVTAGLQIDQIQVAGSTVTSPFSVPNDSDTVAITVSGTDPNAGQVTGSVTITYDDGTNSGTAQNIPVTVECVVPSAPPSVPNNSPASIACADMPVTITGFANVTSFTVTSSVAPATSDYVVTPSAGNTQITVNGNGGAETLTVTASNGNTAEDVDYIINVSACQQGGTFVSVNGETSYTSAEDFVGDIQHWTTHELNGLPNINACGTTINQLILFRRTHSNGQPTEYQLQIVGGSPANIQSFEFNSSSGLPTVVTGGLGNTRTLTQVQYNGVRDHIETVDGYSVTVVCT